LEKVTSAFTQTYVDKEKRWSRQVTRNNREVLIGLEWCIDNIEGILDYAICSMEKFAEFCESVNDVLKELIEMMVKRKP
jgi:hypothetical protein